MNGLVACRRGGQRLGKSALHYNLTDESVNYRPFKSGRKPNEAGDDHRRPSSTSSSSFSTSSSCSSESDCSSDCSLASSIESVGGEGRSKGSRTGSKCNSKNSSCSSCYSSFNCQSESKSSSRASKPHRSTAAFCALCKGQVQYFRVQFPVCGHEMHGECCWRYAAKVPTDRKLSAGTKCARCHWDRHRVRTRQQSVDSIHSNDDSDN